MVLKDTEPDLFEISYDWVYTQTLWDEHANGDERPDTDDLLKLYVFAEMVRTIPLKNQILTAMHSICDIMANSRYLLSPMFGRNLPLQIRSVLLWLIGSPEALKNVTWMKS